MYFGILGPLHVQRRSVGGDGPSPPVLRITGTRQQTILSVLLVNLGEAVSHDQLVEALWPDSPPPRTCRQQVQNCAGQLRRLVSSTAREIPGRRHPKVVIEAGRYGYRMCAQRASVDAFMFEDALHAALARQHCGVQLVVAALRAALSLWRGDPFAGLPAGPVLAAEAARLEELKLIAIEELVSKELFTDQVPALRVAELVALTRQHPFRERLWLLLMEALHRCGRTVEALERYREYRSLLIDSHGVEPGAAIQAQVRTVLTV